jgi:dihydroorotate dehydrogenase electron transfer subunit
LALAAIGSGPGRLLPLIAEAPNAEVAIFCDIASELPLSIEQQGLENLPAALDWADFLAIDIALEDLDDLANYLKLKPPPPKKMQAQVLVRTAMPCGGLAQCGVCVLSTNSGNKLACEDGPVFELRDLV